MVIGNDGSTRPRLCVVTPLANEAATVDVWLERVLAQLAADDCVFCVVDHASSDATREHVAAWQARDARVRLVWAPENRCVVDAYFCGYRAALASGCEWILEMDGGLSHLPEEIPRFIAAMCDGADFAAGSRFVPGGAYVGSRRRWAMSRGGSLLANLLLGTRMRDMTSGFECFDRRALEQVVANGTRSRAHFFQTEIRYMLRDWRCAEVPITYRNPSERLDIRAVVEALAVLWQLRRTAT